MTNQNERAKALRQLAAYCFMLFGLSGAIIWVFLYQRASVEKAFSNHLSRLNLSSLILPYDIRMDDRLVGPESYKAKARLAAGVTLGDVKSSLSGQENCSPKLSEAGVECSQGDWGIWVASKGAGEVEVSITPFSP